MLRSTFNTILTYLSVTGRAAAGGHIKRGTLYADFADFVTDFADGDRAGTILGVNVERKASLANGKMEYYDDIVPTLLCSN